MSFDYTAPAELFLAKRTKSSREKYRRFATAQAIRYAVETLRTPKAFGASLEVGDERFNSTEIQLCTKRSQAWVTQRPRRFAPRLITFATRSGARPGVDFQKRAKDPCGSVQGPICLR